MRATAEPFAFPLAMGDHDAFFDSNLFFKDTPWGSVPSSRLAKLTAFPTVPRGKLLGGSSKLAALAAKRKKQEAEKATAAAPNESSQADRSVSLLDRLGSRAEGTASEGEKPVAPRNLAFPSRQKPPASLEKMDIDIPEAEVVQSLPPKEDMRGSPSIFAQTILGNGQQHQDGVMLSEVDGAGHVSDRDNKFQLPYLMDQNYMKDRPFQKPSPDDIVLRAQHKDSSMGK